MAISEYPLLRDMVEATVAGFRAHVLPGMPEQKAPYTGNVYEDRDGGSTCTGVETTLVLVEDRATLTITATDKGVTLTFKRNNKVDKIRWIKPDDLPKRPVDEDNRPMERSEYLKTLVCPFLWQACRDMVIPPLRDYWGFLRESLQPALEVAEGARAYGAVFGFHVDVTCRPQAASYEFTTLGKVNWLGEGAPQHGDDVWIVIPFAPKPEVMPGRVERDGEAEGRWRYKLVKRAERAEFRKGVLLLPEREPGGFISTYSYSAWVIPRGEVTDLLINTLVKQMDKLHDTEQKVKLMKSLLAGATLAAGKEPAL